MYKTIRHGENSLQYTILPQHDDYKGVDGKQRSVKSGRRKKSLVACLGLFFVCSVIAGAVLVPLMVSVEYMSSPSTWFYKSHKSSAATIKPLKSNRNDKFKVEIDSNEILSFNQQNKHQVYPTKHSTTVTYLPKSTKLDLTSTSKPPKLQSPSLITENLNKSFAKPVISFQPEFNTKPPLNNLDNIEKTKSSENWIKSHWPIVDSSTYFSWTTYESEDNVLLPAIFCIAVVAVVVFILLCFVVRKRNCLCSKKRHDFMAVEAENGDSTVLLANDCPSEDE
ncbi:hypothetical protein Bhyg_14337 [Pseudolycoriella hygida]|uniref:Uncharacterized protein n=1 Tax=Pseudolycoriella hygida TaxID=35572 RepID=A0A9Q0MPU2_9DIPT|nr:hypothetical protein Bhyg_14337 [Pseudolycoriella hygida]